MKAKLKGRITEMRTVKADDGEMVELMLSMTGAVEEAKGPDAKKVHLVGGRLLLKPLAAQELRYNQDLYITVSTEES